MESSLSSRLFIPKKVIKPINQSKNSSKIIMNRNKSSIKTNFNTLNEDLNTSWDFTPFPDLYFPSQKNEAIRNINRLNFKSSLLTPKNSNYNNIFKINSNRTRKSRSIRLFSDMILSPKLLKSNSLSYIFKENKGDITKFSSPAYSFGRSRDECKFPFLKTNEKISPSPCAYNIRPLEGLGGSSLKFSFKKNYILKKYRKHIDPGPGHYNLDKCDIKNNGNIVLSDITNSKISNFGKYEERKDKIGHTNEWNMKPDPGSYNIDNTLTMFSGTGKYLSSKFRSNISKSIDKFRLLSRKIKFIYPGPGDYNHYSIFKNAY